jgi:hypothetical protein
MNALSPYALRAYDKDTSTNVHVSTFVYTGHDRNVMRVDWSPQMALSKKRFLIYPSDACKRILSLEKDKILCLYHGEQLLTWTAWEHVIYPTFVHTDVGEPFLLLIKGESKEQCFETLVQTRRHLH